MHKKILIVLLCTNNISAYISLNTWTELKYNTPSECFATGIKRVVVPFPGIGTIACIKDAVKQLPDFEKSTNLLVGHTAALVSAGLASFMALIVAAYLDIPHAKNILGPEISYYFVAAPKDALKDVIAKLSTNKC